MGNNPKYKKAFKSRFIERVSEEIIPWYSQRLLKEHKIRYLFVKKFVKDKIVLDIACGNGYGSSILANSGVKFVYGIDNSKKAVDYASKHYNQKNINFALGNAEKIKLNNKSADVIVSLETIEHLKFPNQFLKETKRILKSNGILILSTPNRDVSYEDNPFHLREYTLPQLNSLLSDFSKKEYYGQRPVYKKIVNLYKYLYILVTRIPLLSLTKFFLRLRPWENQKIYKLKNLSDTSYMYFIAVCQN